MPRTNPPSASKLAKGDTLADTQLIEPLATGQRIDCWRAEKSDGLPATVHVLSPSASDKERDTFLAGARRLMSLTSNRPATGVVEVYAVVPSDHAYVTRGSMAGTMSDVTILGWGVNETVTFMRRACRALSGLHDARLIHGCLRPANVLLDDDLNPKLSDAGALAIDVSFRGPSDMQHDYAPYAAREVRQGSRATVRSDIFSFGRLMQFALLGEDPQLIDEDIPRLSELKHAPAGLVRIIRRCTLQESGARYNSMDEVLADLARYEDGDTVGIRHPQGEEGTSEAEQSGDVVASMRSDDDVPASVRPRESLAPEESSDPPDSEPPESGKQRDSAPPRLIYHEIDAEPVEDFLTIGQARAIGVFGMMLFGGALAYAYYGGVVSIWAIVATYVGAVAASALLPVLASAPGMTRVLSAIGLALLTWYLDPVPGLAETGLRAKVVKGTPQQRAGEVQQLKQRGVRDFTRTDLRGVDFTDMDLSSLLFDDAQLRGAQFHQTVLSGTSFKRADISGADFSGSDLASVDITVAQGWVETICDDETGMPGGWECIDGAPEPEMQDASPSEDDEPPEPPAFPDDERKPRRKPYMPSVDPNPIDGGVGEEEDGEEGE